MRSQLGSKKSLAEHSSVNSKRSDRVSVNFTLGGGAHPKSPMEARTEGSSKGYGIPTLKMLNPELFKEMQKQER